MSADRVPDGFQLVTKGVGQRTTVPQLTVYGNGQGYLNAVAVDVLGDYPAVQAFVEPETFRVALVGVDGEGEHDYALDCETETSGGDFRFQSALKQLGIDTDDIEETHQFPLTNEDGLLVGDVSALADIGESAADSDSDLESDDADSDTVAEKIGEEIAEKASPDEGSETVDVPDHSSVEPDDIPDLEDESADTDEKVRAFLEHEVADGETLETTCGEIGDAVGEDGRAIVHALKSLDEWDAEKTGKSETNEPSVWAVARSVDDDGGSEDTQSNADGSEDGPKQKIDRGDDPDVQFWCGFCGRGPFVRESMVDGHHDRQGHPGEPVPRTEDPAHTLDDYDEPIVDDERSADERVFDWLDERMPDIRSFTTEDVAIECDITGNAATDALEQVGEQLGGYVIEKDGRLWRVLAPTGGEA